ncbi:hypothetical protein K505DRAFT_258001 [Melanomma pulvis-pyrius CBS 109.77]|uniref:Ubiquitin 3 binding protein But2 C-terminal domain-containing protein n=1 Tax=Melanomma pulvis-pyrius CBS 109.77 TaxID=1314802 RepID=A0A6A6WU86_9PLEO|nr:hypothetical protein K505DRAFT_258001 [Melanomma pulvis-pyrius CBS 109.77]
MHFTTLALTTLLALTTAAPAPIEKRFPSAYRIITPSAISQYSVFTGAIAYNTATGLVRKTGDTQSDISTLVTFTIPPSAAGATCSLHFYLDPADTTVVSGTGLIDLFSSLKPAPEHDVPAWGPPGNQRDREMARWKVVKGGEATFSTDVPNAATFKCPEAGKVGFELVGAGDKDEIRWGKALSGAYITW